MPDITKPAPEREAIGKRQVLWFIGLYCAGLIVTGLVVYFLRWLISI
jgi:cell division septal protein FtsQ